MVVILVANFAFGVTLIFTCGTIPWFGNSIGAIFKKSIMLQNHDKKVKGMLVSCHQIPSNSKTS